MQMNSPAELPHRTCPACGSALFKIIGKKGDSFDVSISETKFLHPPFFIRMCRECCLYYKSNIPAFSTLDNYYQLLNNYYEDLAYLFPTDRATIKEVISAGSNGRILDYGCGTGRVLDTLRKMERYGVEVNPDSVAKAKSRGITIIDENELIKYEDFFDIIILMDVYEHLYQPLETMQRLNRCLKKGGKLIIVTGNSDSVFLKRFVSGYYYFRAFSHLQMLNKKHVTWLADRLRMTLDVSRKKSHVDFKMLPRIKYLLGIVIYLLYDRTSGASFWNSQRIRFVKTWTYPCYETFTRDHLISVLRKE
jgi:SAM-dependent methyltransferase